MRPRLSGTSPPYGPQREAQGPSYLLKGDPVKWLCWFKHSWLYIEGQKRRTCLRCKRYETLHVWRSYWYDEDDSYWLED